MVERKKKSKSPKFNLIKIFLAKDLRNAIATSAIFFVFMLQKILAHIVMTGLYSNHSSCIQTNRDIGYKRSCSSLFRSFKSIISCSEVL